MQILTAVQDVSKLIGWLATKFSKVNVFCICGQHGRMTKKKGVLSPEDNFDYLVYKMMEKQLEEFKNVNFSIPRTWWMIAKCNKIHFYMEHGDEFYSYLGIPFYGLRRGKTRIREVLKEYLDEKGRPVDFDYFLVGHIHTPSFFNKVVSNGAFVGGTEYSLKKLKLGGKPTQMLFSIHPDRGITWYRPIQLSSGSPTVKVYGGD